MISTVSPRVNDQVLIAITAISSFIILPHEKKKKKCTFAPRRAIFLCSGSGVGNIRADKNRKRTTDNSPINNETVNVLNTVDSQWAEASH